MARLRKQEQPLPQSIGSASSKGNSKSPKRQFASDLGVEEQQKGYAESLHSKTSWSLAGMLRCLRNVAAMYIAC